MHAKFLLPFLIAGALAMPIAAEEPNVNLEARSSANWRTGNFFRDKKGNPSVRTRPAKPPPRTTTDGKRTADWPKGKPLHHKRDVAKDEQYESAGEEAFLTARGEDVNKNEDGAEVEEADE
ncbi:hypothetical protein MAPG_02794 [Magnaporthiopsis poae ATCC 64411]|uniref:Uncharacterized protein n=1 Tax=Magnaporthiopsis poae (strain ATCC 64411 / 73-15) TaxID=644358 RepID=A0A0C4DSB6_MAGP6|nr:hypothetical protein MAPG_02794 [Magnaporthiopsis poae ATCC 64411]